MDIKFQAYLENLVRLYFKRMKDKSWAWYHTPTMPSFGR